MAGVIMDSVLHERELDLMHILWDRGSATAAEVRDALADDLAHNTVQTILRRLEEKGHVRREEEGRAHRYYPLLERQQASTSALSRLTNTLFRGSREMLLMHLVSDRELLPREEAERIREMLDQRLAEEEP